MSEKEIQNLYERYDCLAQSVDKMEYQLVTLSGSILTEQTARSTADVALAAQLTALSISQMTTTNVE